MPLATSGRGVFPLAVGQIAKRRLDKRDGGVHVEQLLDVVFGEIEGRHGCWLVRVVGASDVSGQTKSECKFSGSLGSRLGVTLFEVPGPALY